MGEAEDAFGTMNVTHGCAHLETKLEYGISYCKARRRRFSRSAVALRLLSLALSATATIILGLANLTPWIGAAFTMTALVTLVSALEPFFNFRDRWVIMEDGQAKFYRLMDELEFEKSTGVGNELDVAALRKIHDEYQSIWTEMSTEWVTSRRRGSTIN